ncbi:hypothetical protein [Pontibacter chinhatensis]|uniref:EpsG family protein n=1 Tax=Pontibacter chinhatensis TaxID=1436961 RepID=A0A1I2QXE7_9BACT|nr:hypothetical protein [Pontibacter chinhatensis]SFG32730.1 hypothetical protein SAMN05421739_102175 [Pontibacter chinhatensis]
MLGAIFLILLLYAVNQPLIRAKKKYFPFLKVNLLNNLYWWHILFTFVYYLYATFNNSDSKAYYTRVESDFAYPSWLSIYQTGTRFIDFIAYPFVNTLGFSYEMAMVLFAWFGYLGFLYFYIFFKENIRVDLRYKGYDLFMLLLFLPNMHFWTSSLGKGALIFLGIAMFTYALSAPQRRWLSLLVGALIVYHIRPHMFLFLGVGAVAGYITGSEKVPMYQKVLIYVAFIGGLAIMYESILVFANLNEEDVLGSFQDLSQVQAGRLSSAGSGLDITSYPLPLKLFTFWFRPLFFDAPGVLGLYISFENLFYLLLTWKLVDKDFIPFIKQSTSLVKMSLVTFVSSSVALSMVMSNLGIVIRQKSMVMYFFFFVILAFLEYKQQKKKSLKEEGKASVAMPTKRLRLI